MAASVQVGTCRKGDPTFTTIQAAVNASSAGGTVVVCPGTYPEQVTIDKTLTVIGVQSGTMNAAVVSAPPAGIVQNTTSLSSGNPIAAHILVINATGVYIGNLTVDGANSKIDLSGCTPLNLVGVLYQNASGTVNHLAVINQALSGVSIGCQAGLGIFVQSGSGGTSNINITNNYVENYQKNGITANEPGTTVTITANSVVGQGPTNGAAENSIQVGFGATGKVTANVAMDDVFAPDMISSPGNAASGILVFASSAVSVTGNAVGNTQFGIAFVSDATAGPADNGTIQGNKISAPRVFDGIGAGSNTIGSNLFYSTRNTVLTADTCTPPVMAPTPLVATHMAAASTQADHARPNPARP